MKSIVLTLAFTLAAPSLASAATIVTQYEATLNSANVISGGINSSAATSSATATFTLTKPDGNPAGTTLSYNIQLTDLDLDGTITPGSTDDNVTAIHLHNVALLANLSPNLLGDTAGTQHVLNIFGVPRGGDDDDDMVFNAAAGTVAGLWEDSDATPLEPMAPTFPISSVLSGLQNGDFFLMVHTSEYPGGAIGGFITPVPEPSTGVLALLGMVGLFGFAYRKRSRRN